MSLTRFPHGISSFGVPVLGAGPIVTTGTVYFVHHTGSNSNSGLDPTQPFANLTTAITACTTNKGDVIILMPSHAETISTTVTLSKANVSIIGLGNGTARPNLTQGTTGSTGMLTVSGSNNRIANVYFTGSATGTNEPLLTISTGSNVTVEGCVFAPASKQLYTILLSGTATADITIRNCDFIATAAGPDAIIFSSVMVHRVQIIGCYFNVVGSAGCDHGIITVSSSASLGWLIKDCVFMGMADGEPAVKPLAASTGLVANCLAYTADVTDIILPSNILGTIDLLATEAAKAAQFTVKHPATTTTA